MAFLNVAVTEQERARDAIRSGLSNDQAELLDAPPGSDSEGDQSVLTRSIAFSDRADDVVGPNSGRHQVAKVATRARKPYQLGGTQAEQKLVVFYDYQDEKSKQIEREITALLADYGDKVSVTARHYPLCSDCNLWLDSNLHPDACRAAFAAEAAGVMKGDAGVLANASMADRAGRCVLRSGASRMPGSIWL